MRLHFEPEAVAGFFVDGFQPSGGSTIDLLGGKDNLKWKHEENGFRIYIPASFRKKPPCDHAWAFRINMNNEDLRG